MFVPATVALNGSTLGEKLNKQPATINCLAALFFSDLAEVAQRHAVPLR
jgi:hypothetical protein